MSATPISPTDLAALVSPYLDEWLLGFDVDGVLAPIVDHADSSRLSPGVWDAIDTLARRSTIAVVSGRSLESLERLFGFPTHIHVIGSHGLEERGIETLKLTDADADLGQLETLGTKTVEAIGDGAWLEYKVASVVVHSREADQGRAMEATAVLRRLAEMVDGAAVKPGSAVVELLAREGNKGLAFTDLALRLGKVPGFFIGDDVTDEDTFAMVAPDGVSVRVGPGETAATHRLDNAAAAAEFVVALAAST